MPFDEIETNVQATTLANEALGTVFPAALFAKRYETTTGLTFGYYGGVLLVDGVFTSISNGTVSLTGSATNYVQATRSGTVSANTTGFTAGYIPLWELATGSASITTFTDRRFAIRTDHVGSYLSKAWSSDANLTLTAAEARAKFISMTGSGPTTTRDLILPASGDWFISNELDSQSIRVIEPGSPQGSGVVIANARGAFVYGDGVSIHRATADAVLNP